MRPTVKALLSCTLASSLGCGLPGVESVFPEPSAAPVTLWKATMGAMDTPEQGSDASPAAAGGRLYAAQRNALFALDMATGTRVWRSAPATFLGVRNLLVRDGRVYAAGTDAMAFDGITGATLWTNHLVDTWSSTNAVDDVGFYVATRAVVYAFAVATGATRWSYDVSADWPLGGRLHAVITSGDTVYALGRKFLTSNGGSQAASLFAFRRSDGALLWKWELPGPSSFVTPPVVRGRMLIGADLDGSSIVALDRFTKELSWRTNLGAGFDAAVEASGSMLYAGSLNGYVYALDPTSGHQVWQSDKRVGSIFDVRACGSSLLANDGNARILDPSTGRLLNDYGVGVNLSAFLVADNRAYVQAVSAVYALVCR